MIYVNINYHKKYSQVSAMDKDGNTLVSLKIPNEENPLKSSFMYFQNLVKWCLKPVETGKP